MSEWKFEDPPNMAVIIDRRVVEEGAWIAAVSHDASDGAWQIHSEALSNASDAMVISLRSAIELDPSINELADLPLGWRASRASRTARWQRMKA